MSSSPPRSSGSPECCAGANQPPPPPPLPPLELWGPGGDGAGVQRQVRARSAEGSSGGNRDARSASPEQRTAPIAAARNSTPSAARDGLSGSRRRTRTSLDASPPAAAPPTRHLVVDHEVLQKELDALHDSIFACDAVPALLREECTDIMQEINRCLTLDHIRFTEREAELSARAAAGGGGSNTAAATKAMGTPRLANTASGSSAPSPHRPLQQPWGKVSTEKLRRSWRHLVRAVKGRMSEEELALLSLPTIKDLMHFYVLDRDPVEIANVELYWRALAQQREDERNKKALPHKKCGAVPPNPTAHVRDISKQYSSPAHHQRGADGTAASTVGSASPRRGLSSNAATAAGSFRVNR